MRGTTIAILVLAVIGASGHVWRNGGWPELALLPAAWTKVGSTSDGPDPTRAAGSASASDDRSRNTNGDATVDPRSDDEGEVDATASASTPGKSVYYQWVDGQGSVHFARALGEVPAEWQARAGRFEVDADAAAPSQTPTLASAGATGAAGTKRPRPARQTAKAHGIERVAAVEPPVSRNHDVTIYTAPWCGWCRKTRAFLDARGVVYENKDIELVERYADELREKTGKTAIPFVEIDGAELHGFDPDGMTRLLRD